MVDLRNHRLETVDFEKWNTVEEKTTDSAF